MRFGFSAPDHAGKIIDDSKRDHFGVFAFDIADDDLNQSRMLPGLSQFSRSCARGIEKTCQRSHGFAQGLAKLRSGVFA